MTPRAYHTGHREKTARAAPIVSVRAEGPPPEVCLESFGLTRSLLIKDLGRMARRAPRSLRRYALVVTTFFHVHEVRALLAKAQIEVVGLLAEASQTWRTQWDKG